MINSDLSFLYSDNGVFTDYSLDAKDFLRDSFSLSVVSAEDYIYIGLDKPFYKLYAELRTAASASINIAAAISNGASFESVDLQDHSKGFSRSAFLDIAKSDNWAAQSINGESKFWLRLAFDADSTVEFDGFNLVLSDDNDLKAEMYNISDFRPTGMLSFISYHVSTRDEIIQKLRNSGKIVKDDTDTVRDIVIWDLHRPDQLRVAAKYLALSKIMFDVSSETDDKYYQRYQDYLSEFAEAMRVYLLSFDSDNDGKEDIAEKNGFRTSQFIKV